VRDVRIQGLRVNGETIDSTDHPKVKTNEHVVGLSFER